MLYFNRVRVGGLCTHVIEAGVCCDACDVVLKLFNLGPWGVRQCREYVDYPCDDLMIKIFGVWIMRIESELIDVKAELLSQSAPHDWCRIHDQQFVEVLLSLRFIPCVKVRQQKLVHNA